MDGKGTECVAVGICIRLVWLIAPLGRVSVLVVGLKRLNKDCTGRICSSTPTSPYPAPFSASEILPSSEHTVKTAIAGLGSGWASSPGGGFCEGRRRGSGLWPPFSVLAMTLSLAWGAGIHLAEEENSREALKKTQLLCPCPEWCVTGTQLPSYKEEIKPKCGGRLLSFSC